MSAPFALFAFGGYYPNGGFSDYRGSFETVEQCRLKFNEIIPELMGEMGYGRTTGNGDLTGQIVKIESMDLIETLRA